MTVNKEKWQELAKKYNTKAKWADAILLLSLEDHEDLISALIELDPQELVDNSGDSTISLNFSGGVVNCSIREEDIIQVINRELGRGL